MATGTLWAVNTTGVASRGSMGTPASASDTRAAAASMKRGWSGHAGASSTSGAPSPTSARADATSPT